MANSIESQIRHLQRGIDDLATRLAEPATDAKAVAGDAVAELATALEELRAAHQQAEFERSHFESIVESAGDAIVAIDHDQRIFLFNRAASEMFGWSAAEIVGRPLAVVLPDVIDGHEELVSGFADESDLERRRGTRPTLELTRRNGDEFPAEITVSKVRLDERWAFTAVITDVTVRERALQELRFADEFNRRVIAALDALVVVLDPDGRILVFNGACERATGFAFSEVEGRQITEVLIPPDERSQVGGVFDELAGGQSESTFENDWLTAAGGRRRIRWSNAVLVDESGQVTHVIGTGIDVTHERELEQQLIVTQQFEAIGQLAGAVAHDFNNLLSIMQGHLELLSDSDRLPPSVSDRASSIAAAVMRGKALIANLTDISRHDEPPSPIVHLNDSTTALGRILSDILGPDVSLVLELGAEPDLVRIDPTRVEQVLLNLVLNACDAMADGGQVTIATRSQPDADGTAPGLMLTVTDSGSGMDAATRARAFEPFFTTKGSRSGTGLGLASTRLIVESAGGRVSAESQPGQGTTVSVWLPLTDERDSRTELGAAVDGAEVGDGATDAARATILLVDDEAELLDVVRDMLEGAGHQVFTASNAASAMAVAEEHGDELDVLVTDVVMPGQDGTALADALVARLPDLAVIFMTAYAEPEHQQQSEHQNRPFLRKPFSRGALLAEVRAARRR